MGAMGRGMQVYSAVSASRVTAVGVGATLGWGPRQASAHELQTVVHTHTVSSSLVFLARWLLAPCPSLR